MTTDETFFNANLDLLMKTVSPKRNISNTFYDCIVSQLRTIFQQTEKAWNQNIKSYKCDIEYLLICEAPPWTFYSTASYFYLQSQGQLFSAVRKTFFGNSPKNRQKTYACLAKQGFLLIDSLPYSFQYTTQQRKSKAYLNMIKHSLSWWTGKLNNSGLNFSPNMKIALGYYWNGLKLIEATGGKFQLTNNQAHTITQGKFSILGNSYVIDTGNLISNKGTRYLPSSKELDRVYNINQKTNCP